MGSDSGSRTSFAITAFLHVPKKTFLFDHTLVISLLHNFQALAWKVLLAVLTPPCRGVVFNRPGKSPYIYYECTFWALLHYFLFPKANGLNSAAGMALRAVRYQRVWEPLICGALCLGVPQKIVSCLG